MVDINEIKQHRLSFQEKIISDMANEMELSTDNVYSWHKVKICDISNGEIIFASFVKNFINGDEKLMEFCMMLVTERIKQQ